MKKKLFFILIFASIAIPVHADDKDMAYYYLQKSKIEAVQEQRYDYILLAKNHFLKALKKDPLNTDIMLALSETYKLTGDRRKANLYLLKVYNTNPSNPYYKRELGDFYYHFQEYATAIEYYKRALADGLLKDFDTNFKTAECYEKLGDEENTALYYKIAFYLNPNSNKAKKKNNEYVSVKKTNELQNEEPKYKYLFKEKINNSNNDKSEIEKIINEINSF